MGKAAKTRATEQRKKMKRSKKEQQRALYASYKSAGTNKKSKRGAGGGGTVLTTKHAISNCGNHGCERCFPHLALQRMNDSNDPRVRFRTLDQIKKENAQVLSAAS